MNGPSDEFREAVAAQAAEIQSEDDLERMLEVIEEQMEGDLAEGGDSDPLDELSAIEAWAGLASFAAARFYAPSSPWPRRIGGWSRTAVKRLRSIATTLQTKLTAVANHVGASSWSIGVSFPWGIQISLTWP